MPLITFVKAYLSRRIKFNCCFIAVVKTVENVQKENVLRQGLQAQLRHRYNGYDPGCRAAS